MAANYQPPQWLVPNMGPGNINKVGNYSFQFDGATDYVDLGTTPIVTGIFSASMWIKRSALAGGDAYQVFLGKDNQLSGGTLARVFNTYITQSTGVLSFWVSDTGNYDAAYRCTTSTVINDTNWHHLVFINTGDSVNLKVYIDGTEASYSATGTGRTTLKSTTAVKTSIGADANTGSTYCFLGNIDHVAIFDYVLTAGNVTTLYGNSTDGVGNPMDLTTAPVAYYKLGDLAAYNGTNYLVPNAISTNFSNYALDFDGSSDYIDIIDSAVPPASFQDIGDNNSYSISAWIKTYVGVTPPNPWSAADTIVELRQEGGAADMKVPFSFGVSSNKDCFGRTAAYLTNPETVLSTTSVNNNEWRHVVIVIVDDAYTFYVDGIADGTGTFSTDGSISNISIYNSALTSAQVTTLYNEGKPSDLSSFSPAPVAWWQLGENSYYDGSDWIVLDEIGTNNGTSSGMSEDDLVNGVQTTANGVSSGMGTTNIKGDAPYSSNNAISYNMGVTAKETSTP